MPGEQNALVSALGELTALGTERDREQLVALLERLDAARLRVLVVGEAKRGKSTLVNALLGRDVLPSGVTPLTAVTTTVRYGDDERAEVRFLDGHDEKHPLTALPDLVTERGNPGNRRRIADVTVYVAAPVLAGGVELADTPGTGSVFEWDTQAARAALRVDGRGGLRADRRPAGVGQRAGPARAGRPAVGDHVRGAEQGRSPRRAGAGRGGGVHQAGARRGGPSGPGVPDVGARRRRRQRRRVCRVPGRLHRVPVGSGRSGPACVRGGAGPADRRVPA